MNFVHLTSFEFAIAPDSQLTSALASSDAFPILDLESKIGIQASNFDRIKPPRRLRRIHFASKLRNPTFELRPHQTSTPASSHPPRIQASKSKLRTSITSNLHSGPSSQALLHPSFGIQASNFDRIKPPCRLRHINIASKLWNSSHPNFSFVASTSHPSIYILYPSCGIQALIFDLSCNRCACSAMAFKFVLNTCIGNNGLSLGARARSHFWRAPAFTWSARPLCYWFLCENL